MTEPTLPVTDHWNLLASEIGAEPARKCPPQPPRGRSLRRDPCSNGSDRRSPRPAARPIGPIWRVRSDSRSRRSKRGPSRQQATVVPTAPPPTPARGQRARRRDAAPSAQRSEERPERDRSDRGGGRATPAGRTTPPRTIRRTSRRSRAPPATHADRPSRARGDCRRGRPFCVCRRVDDIRGGIRDRDRRRSGREGRGGNRDERGGAVARPSPPSSSSRRSSIGPRRGIP